MQHFPSKESIKLTLQVSSVVQNFPFVMSKQDSREELSSSEGIYPLTKLRVISLEISIPLVLAVISPSTTPSSSPEIIVRIIFNP